MINSQRYRDMKNKYVYLFIAVCILIVIPLPFVYRLINPVSKMNSYLESGSPSEAVAYYNDNDFSNKNQNKIDNMLDTYMDDLKNQYESNILTADDCIAALEVLKNVKNSELTQKAADILNVIKSEDAGNEALAKATELLNEKKYTEAMKTVKDISRSFSKYNKLKDIYDQSRDEIKKRTESPETIEEYKESIEILDECIGETEDEILIEEKEQLINDYEDQKEVYDTITEAADSYEEESFSEAFESLEKGTEKHPDNEKLKKAKMFFENAYILQISEEVISYAENEDYVNAQRILNEAVQNYNSPELQEILEQFSRENLSYELINEKIADSKEKVYQAAMEYIPEKYTAGLTKEEIMNALNSVQLQQNIDISAIISQIKINAAEIIKN